MSKSKFDQAWTQPGATSGAPPRVRGRSSNPEYSKLAAYVPVQVHLDVKIACLKHKPPIDISDVVEQQLVAWLKTQP